MNATEVPSGYMKSELNDLPVFVRLTAEANCLQKTRVEEMPNHRSLELKPQF